MTVSTISLTLAADRCRDQVQPGDVIVEIDGRPMRRTLVVHPEPWTMPGALRLVNPLGTETVWNLYPDTQVHTDITVLREDVQPDPPAAPKEKRPATRIIGGLRFISTGGERWLSEDGRWEIRYDNEFLTECENPHPVRISPAMRQSIQKDPRFWPVEAREAVRMEQRGYLCSGGQEHTYGRWAAWDNEANDYSPAGSPGWAESFTEVVQHLEGVISRLPDEDDGAL